MTETTNDRATMGGNLPPIADLLAIHYDGEALATRNAPLLSEVDALEARFAAFTEVETEEANTAAAKLVKDARALATRITAIKETEKRPLLTAGSAVEEFVKGAGTALTGHKGRVERLIGGFATRKAEDERKKRLEEAAELQRRADEQAAAAATAETGGEAKRAGLLLDHAVRKAELATTHASGTVQELGRTRTEEGTTTLTDEWSHTIVNVDDLKATLGPLRDCFTLDAVEAALRKFRIAEVKADRMPVLPGVRFDKTVKGLVR